MRGNANSEYRRPLFRSIVESGKVAYSAPNYAIP